MLPLIAQKGFWNVPPDLTPLIIALHAIRGEIAQIQDRDDEAAREFAKRDLQPPGATPMRVPLYGIQLHLNLASRFIRSLDEL